MEGPDLTDADAQFGLEAFRWLEAQPGWSRLGPKRQEVAAYLALNEANATHGTLTHRSVSVMARDSLYTRDQIKDTLRALREHGLAYPIEQFVDSKQGRGRHQAASHYRLAKGKTHEVSARRREAAKLGLARREARRPVGRLVFTPAQDAHVQHQMRNREFLQGRASETLGRNRRAR
jgi:hypothetical protein